MNFTTTLVSTLPVPDHAVPGTIERTVHLSIDGAPPLRIRVRQNQNGVLVNNSDLAPLAHDRDLQREAVMIVKQFVDKFGTAVRIH